MRELQAIIERANKAQPGESLVLATVVRVQGSAYRRPGARMLIAAQGPTVGTISGGCLEADVRERAHGVMASGKPQLVTYDSTAPADIVFGLGLGCNGVVEIWIEPLTVGDAGGMLAFLTACQEQRLAGRCATLFRADGMDLTPGARLLHWPDGSVTATTEDKATLAALNTALRDDAPDSKPISRTIELAAGGQAGVLVETIAPPVPLVLFGAGDDAVPLVEFAKRLGWHVTVVDVRPSSALPERFPGADAVHCIRPDALHDCPQRLLTPNALAMIMTHNYTQDKDWLQMLLPLGLPYVGILGPKARTQRLLDELREDGETFSEETLARLHGPAGLDIGAETPEEVALSILAEMQTVLSGRTGAALKLKEGGIHDASPNNKDAEYC